MKEKIKISYNEKNDSYKVCYNEFLDSYRKQKATYSDGTTVVIDLDRNTYKIN